MALEVGELLAILGAAFGAGGFAGAVAGLRAAQIILKEKQDELATMREDLRDIKDISGFSLRFMCRQDPKFQEELRVASLHLYRKYVDNGGHER